MNRRFFFTLTGFFYFANLATLDVVLSFLPRGSYSGRESGLGFISVEGPKMGVIYLHPPVGQKVFNCAKCDAFIADAADVSSTLFRGSTGPATLFSRTYNTVQG